MSYSSSKEIQEQLLTEDVMGGFAFIESGVVNQGTEERSSLEGEQRLQAREAEWWQREVEERQRMEDWRRKVEEREDWWRQDNRWKEEWRREKRVRELAFRRLALREEELELQPLIEDMEADIMDVVSIKSGVVNEDTEELSSLEREAEEQEQDPAGEMLLWRQEQVPAGEELWRDQEPEPKQEERQELESSTPAPAARLEDRERRKVDLEWIFVIVNFVLELPSAVFDQLSSVRKPQFSLLSMVMSFAALFICIVELVYKCRKEKVTWKWRGTLSWLYPPRSHKPFSSFKDIIGPVCAICQCVVATITFNFCLRHASLLCSKFLSRDATL